jgi:hypothetical protein
MTHSARHSVCAEESKFVRGGNTRRISSLRQRVAVRLATTAIASRRPVTLPCLVALSICRVRSPICCHQWTHPLDRAGASASAHEMGAAPFPSCRGSQRLTLQAWESVVVRGACDVVGVRRIVHPSQRTALSTESSLRARPTRKCETASSLRGRAQTRRSSQIAAGHLKGGASCQSHWWSRF